MKRLLVFALMISLIFCFTACVAIEDASPGESSESGKSNTETIMKTEEPETIDYTEIAQQAYDSIEDAESLCKAGMSIISAAWHFGIWDAPECGVDIVTERLSVQTGFENMIRELTDDYTHYQSLRDYYTKVVAYASYFENISGSYNDLIEAITEYENDIQSVKEPLLFNFG